MRPRDPSFQQEGLRAQVHFAPGLSFDELLAAWVDPASAPRPASAREAFRQHDSLAPLAGQADADALGARGLCTISKAARQLGWNVSVRTVLAESSK